VLRAYQADEGFPWPVAIAGRQMIEDYNVISTSIKVAVDPRGVVAYRRGYGVESADQWRALFRSLAP
jgi:hypothetical protein